MSKELIIENTTIVTMNPQREILTNRSFAIRDEYIEKLGSHENLRHHYPDARHIDGRGKVVMPGLINAHTHLSMSLQKGLTLSFEEGLYRIMWPVEKSLTSEDCYIGSLAGGGESVKGGATCIADHYFHIEQTARAITEVGLRGVLGHTIMSHLGPITGETEMEAGLRFISDWKGRHPLVIPWLAPHATDTVSQDWLIMLREIASSEGTGLHLHVAQSPREREYIREKYDLGCVEYLDSIGFLGPDVIAAHCIFIEDLEIDLLARSGTHPVYCPMGHSLGGRPARAWEMLERGAGVLVATDCVTSNNVMDILGELRIAGAAQKQLVGDSLSMPASKILEMVTVDAADAIGMGDQLGTLAPGFLADIIMININGLHTAPNYSLLDNIVYCCNGRDVDMVIVNGDVVVEDNKLTKLDEFKLVASVEKTGRALIRRALENEQDFAGLWNNNFNTSLFPQ